MKPQVKRRRRMPAAHKVAKYWADRGDVFQVDLDDPRCFGCCHPVNNWGRLERAHLINHAEGGLDHEGNLALLCRDCHRVMPSFYNFPGEWEEAVMYVRLCGTPMWREWVPSPLRRPELLLPPPVDEMHWMWAPEAMRDHTLMVT